MIKFPCRCRKCGSRKTLAKHPDIYVILRYAQCACGGEFRVDNYRRKKEHKRTNCYCNGLNFPHRKAGSVWCVNHPIGPSEADLNFRYGYA